MPDAPPKLLYYGDNLDILRRYANDESVDLVYLERAVQFERRLQRVVRREERREGPGPDHGVRGHVPVASLEPAQEYAEVLHSGETRVAKALKGMHDFLGGSDMMAYLSMKPSFGQRRMK